ncbi:MAG: SemiSWEET family transporter [Nocardioidaceae bacterium]|nr:SemiSWEET family transporter [Nocardioidaceae bacterium]
MGLAPALQIRIMVRNRSAGDTSACWVVILLIGLLLWLAYGTVTGSAPLVITNAVSCTVLLILLATIAYFRGRQPRRTSPVSPSEGGSHVRIADRA